MGPQVSEIDNSLKERLSLERIRLKQQLFLYETHIEDKGRDYCFTLYCKEIPIRGLSTNNLKKLSKEYPGFSSILNKELWSRTFNWIAIKERLRKVETLLKTTLQTSNFFSMYWLPAVCEHSRDFMVQSSKRKDILKLLFFSFVWFQSSRKWRFESSLHYYYFVTFLCWFSVPCLVWGTVLLIILKTPIYENLL